MQATGFSSASRYMLQSSPADTWYETKKYPHMFITFLKSSFHQLRAFVTGLHLKHLALSTIFKFIEDTENWKRTESMTNEISKYYCFSYKKLNYAACNSSTFRLMKGCI